MQATKLTTEPAPGTVHYWVARDCVLSSGKKLMSEALTPVFERESQARKALKLCGVDDAYIVEATTLR